MPDRLVVLVPSPLLGSASWQDVAGVLRSTGHEVLVTGGEPVVRSPGAVVDRVAPLAGPDELLPSWTRWSDEADVAALPLAYPALGDIDAAELAEARRRGWPTTRLEGRHLHPLFDPAGVAEAVVALAARAGVGADRALAGGSIDG